jgi:hypothetical protein
VNDYNVADLTAQFTTKVGDRPLAILGDYIQNLADPKSAYSATAKKTGDSGYQMGLIFGKASEPQTWEAAYFYKMAKTDSTLADLSDSDFGEGGLNRKGHIVWYAYNITKLVQAKVKYFMTEIEDTTAPGFAAGSKDKIDRLQMDFSMKF